ncbi:MAG TPA: ABC transporter permease [Anaerolineae bacterium]|nr:ABC transporter permease [Anaerolineae bacterium]
MEFVARPTNRFQRFLNQIPVLGDVLRRPLGALGFVIVLGFMLMVVFAPLLAPYDYAEQDIPSMLQGPSRQHWLGTDHLGRDLWSRIVYGARIALAVAVPAVAIALVGGIALGLIAGYTGGVVDDIAVVLMDSLQAFPAVILALAILALLGSSLVNVIIVIGLAWIPGYARITRAQVLSAKQNQYVEVERSLGATQRRILGIHILPNIVAPLLILAAMDLPVVITFEAGLSFLGLGVRPPTPSWGVILSDGFNFIRQSPWPITWAGLTLIIATLGFTLFGETLRDVLDPRLSGTRGV